MARAKSKKPEYPETLFTLFDPDFGEFDARETLGDFAVEGREIVVARYRFDGLVKVTRRVADEVEDL